MPDRKELKKNARNKELGAATQASCYPVPQEIVKEYLAGKGIAAASCNEAIYLADDPAICCLLEEISAVKQKHADDFAGLIQ